ncbi:MAG: AraC family transcriptional regulator [Rhodobacterales bacterium]|nr:MAG: AraC family transcriptional regulator [Rhodobacterales bacterium]
MTSVDLSNCPTLSPLARSLAGRQWRLSLQHSRKHAVILWITRGQGRAVLRGRETRFGPHSLIYVPANTLFSVDAGVKPLGHIIRIPDTDATLSGLLPETEALLRVRDLHDQADLSRMIETASMESEIQEPLHEAAMTAHVVLIAVWMNRALAQRPPAPPARADARLAARFCDLVVRHYRSGRSMAQYAEILGVTPTHLARCCKSSAGTSAANILTERSLYAARDLLCSTDHPFRQIAAHLGFGSPAYFTRFVHHHTGHSPTDLRRAG